MTDQPRPTDVRRRVLSGHRALREQLLVLRRACEDIATGEADRDALRLRAESVRDALEAQIGLEREALGPILEETPGYGEERVEELTARHEAQRTVFSELLALVANGADDAELSERACAVIDRMRRELATEDREVLDPNVVKDDPIDVSVGS